MDIIAFEKKLNELGLSKKDFANLVGATYNGVVNWNSKGETPKWVESWLDNYKYKKFYELMKTEFEKFKE